MTSIAVDPVEFGLVESLARPGGNITGLTNITVEIAGKRLELFKETVPTLGRIAVLYDPANPGNVLHAHAVQTAGRALGVMVQLWELRGPDDFERLFTALRAERPDGLYVPGGPLTRTNETRIVGFAVQSGLPSVHDSREAVEAGGLMSYAYDLVDQYRRLVSGHGSTKEANLGRVGSVATVLSSRCARQFSWLTGPPQSPAAGSLEER
jgi:putative ABC transport system substrate-binding protein